MKTLKEIFESLLARMGVKAQSLAEKCGVNPATISNAINGKTSVEDSTILAMARALKLSQEEIQELFLAAAIKSSSGEAATIWQSIARRTYANPVVADPRPLDPEILIESIKLTQEFIDISREEATPERSARIIALIYETWIKNRNTTRNQLLKLVVNNA